MLAALASLAFTAPALAPAGSVCAIYRFDPSKGPLRGKTLEEAADAARSWGVRAVFGRFDERTRAVLRSRGIRVFATLAAFEGERHWRRRPESRPIDAEGLPVRKAGWYAGVCPSQRWLLAELKREAARLARAYDGVWLDFVRYPGYWERPDPWAPQTCFCPACLERFSGEADLSYPESAATSKEKAAWILAQHAERWRRFKTATIREAVQSLAASIRKANPAAMIGVFAIPWALERGEGAVALHLGQDRAELGVRVDVLSPMAYHALLKKPAAWIQEVVDAFSRTTARPVWPAIALPPKGAAGFREALAEALAPPSQGAIVLSWDRFGEAAVRELRAACPR